MLKNLPIKYTILWDRNSDKIDRRNPVYGPKRALPIRIKIVCGIKHTTLIVDKNTNNTCIFEGLFLIIALTLSISVINIPLLYKIAIIISHKTVIISILFFSSKWISPLIVMRTF